MNSKEKDIKHLESNLIPELYHWNPTKKEMLFIFDGSLVKAKFSNLLGEKIDGLDSFIILKKHYKERMQDIVHHINYFKRIFWINSS